MQKGDIAFEFREIAIRIVVKILCMVLQHTFYWLKLDIQNWEQISVAMVMTNVFLKKLNYELRNLTKTLIIFVEIEHIKDLGGHILAQNNRTAISHTMEWS